MRWEHLASVCGQLVFCYQFRRDAFIGLQELWTAVGEWASDDTAVPPSADVPAQREQWYELNKRRERAVAAVSFVARLYAAGLARAPSSTEAAAALPLVA